jgi:hypothetical protein
MAMASSLFLPVAIERGYLIGSQEAGKIPLPPKAKLQWRYRYYLVTERGRANYLLG